MKYPFVSVIIPVYNEERNVPRLFSSLSRLDYPKNRLELIVVDGGSTDKTRSICERYHAKILDNPKRIRGAGCTIGVGVARGEYCAFTDADCVVPRGWITGLLQYFRKPEVASVGGPNVTPLHGSAFSLAVGFVMDFLTKPGSRYGWKGKEVVSTYHNPGCNVLYRTDAIQSVGNFDENLLTCEDEELDFRLREHGYTLLCTPEVVVEHFRRSSFTNVFIQSYRYSLGRGQAIRKHFGMARWFHFLPLLGFLSLVLIGGAAIFHLCPIAIFLDIFVLFLISGIGVSLIPKLSHTSSVPVWTYTVILFEWIIGWGIGLSFGLIGIPYDIKR